MMIAIAFSISSVSFAEEQNQVEVYSTQGVPQNSDLNASAPKRGSVESLEINEDNYGSGGLPSVQMSEFEMWVEKKMFEIVELLQTFAQPFAIVIFIGSALMSLVGAFGNSSLVGKGLIGMILAIIMYAVVLSAPELLDRANTWLYE